MFAYNNLANSYENTGRVIETYGSGVDYYESGTGTKEAILIIPDVWGYNSGRTRSIADMLAAEGYYVVVPKLLTPCLEGGTDGVNTTQMI